MNNTLQQAKRLLSADEMELFERSLEPGVATIIGNSLKDAIRRSRALRDKYRDLYQRQSLRSEERGGSRQDDNQRTLMKAQIMAEVLQRYEAQRDRTLD